MQFLLREAAKNIPRGGLNYVSDILSDKSLSLKSMSRRWYGAGIGAVTGTFATVISILYL